MRKHYFGFIALSFLAVFCLASCSKELPIVEEGPVDGYVISIPAQAMGTKAVAQGEGEATATFKTTENVYIYNRTTSTLDDATLHPSTDDAFTILTGTLNKTNYSVGNQLTVLYNTDSKGLVNYTAQDGAIDHVVDAGWGDVTITRISGDNDITTNVADIQNVQSIFRFVFRKAGTSDELSGVRFVRIFSEQNKLQTQYNVLSDTPTYGPVTISRSDDLSNNYIYAGLRFSSNPGDAIVFQVVTSDGKVYSGSKNAPSAGFVNGKLYTTTVDVNLYTFTVASGKKVCFSPGDLGVEVVNGQNVYSFTEPFTDWGHGNTTGYNDADAVKAVAKRVWFDFFYESGLASNTLYGITGWRIPERTADKDNPYEWNYLVKSRTMEDNDVARYYKVIIPGHKYCLLLPPDETQSSDIGEDLTSGEVTDYVKYLGKGFVLLFNTNRGLLSPTNHKWSWLSSTSIFFPQGWYWTKNDDRNRYYFTWPSSGPAVDWVSNRMRNHIRYVHNVE